MSFNNNGGQGYQDPYAYIGSEPHVRALERQRSRDAEAARRWGEQHANDIVAWQNHCAQLEHALGEWQRAHARQALQIQQLESDWAELRQNADNSIAKWEAHSNKLKAENAELRERLEQAARVPEKAADADDDVQATISALRQMNSQLQGQVVRLESNHEMDEAKRSQGLTQLLKQYMDLANKVSDAQRSVRREMATHAQPLAELQALYETLMTRALCLEDELRLEDEKIC